MVKSVPKIKHASEIGVTFLRLYERKMKSLLFCVSL